MERFVLTLIVNMIARAFIVRGEHGRRGTGATGMTLTQGGKA